MRCICKTCPCYFLGFLCQQLDSTYIGKCKRDIDKALSLESDLPDAHIASGFYYYYCDEDFDKALIHFSKAAELDPGNYEPLFYMALVYRRMGYWKESQSLFTRSFVITHRKPFS